MLRHGELAVVVANRSTRSAAAAMGQQRNIFARRQSLDAVLIGEHTKFDKVIAAAARPKLRPRSVLILPGNRADGPIRLQHLMVATLLEGDPHAKTGFHFDGLDQLLA